jgi:peptidoglycan DL-endopeptidase CwlO
LSDLSRYPNVPLSRFHSSGGFTRRALLALVTGAVLGTTVIATPGLGAPGAGLLATPSRGSLDRQITDASNQLEIVIEQYDSTRVALAATKAKEATVNKQLAPLETAMRAAHAKVAVIAAGIYQQPPITMLAGMLDASSAPELADRLGMVDEIAYAHQQQVDALDKAAASYLAQKQKLTVLDSTQTNESGVLKAKRASIVSQISQLRTLRLTAYGPAGEPPAPAVDFVPVFTADAAGAAVRFAYQQLGKAYRFGAAGPKAYDCSGLTMQAWKAAGVNLPHSAAGQYSTVQHISRAQLRPGDLVFYFHPIHHVGIYVGDGKVIHAPTYGRPVQIGPLDLASIAGYGRP